MWKASSFRHFLSVAAIACVALSAIDDCAWAQAWRVMPIEDQPGYIPDAREEQLPASFQKQAVFYRTGEPAGTIIIDTANRYLYLIQGNNRAIRYGIGVGRE